MRNYLSTPAHVHYRAWSARWFAGSAALFPGVSGLALSLVAIGSGVAFSDRRARMALAFGLGGRETAAMVVRNWYDSGQKAAPKLQTAAESAQRNAQASVSAGRTTSTS